MPAKRATKSANINATLYDGDFQLGFDCVGVEVCRFALCSFMPPTADEECFFLEHGSCKHPQAQHAALDAFCSRIKRELKRYSDMDVKV